MRAVRAPHVFDGERFLDGGATVVVDEGRVVGVEPFGAELPDDVPTDVHTGTLLPGLVDAHAHLVCDSGPMALDRVAGYDSTTLREVVHAGLAAQLRAGVTTVRDLGDRDFAVVEHRDRQRASAGPPDEPRVVASGPPITVVDGHCHYLGGAVSGEDAVLRAVDERAERGVDVVKVMASGGVNTPGTDVLLTQFTLAELRLLVDRAHSHGLPVTAHAHGTPAVEQAVAAGVDGVEHCTCATEAGFGQASDELLDELAAADVAVCPTLGADLGDDPRVPPPLQAVLDRLGLTMEQMTAGRLAFVARLHRAGVRLVSGVDSGIQPPKRHGALPFAVVDLVTSGLPVAQALATATSGAARVLGLDAEQGRLAPGQRADLLVVDGDLAHDVAALHRPVGVYLAGRPLPR
ncbi:amidohydrolase family protein [Angustibacter peucedani]